MNRPVGPVVLVPLLALLVACSGSTQAAVPPAAGAVAPTAASLSTATSVPLVTATAVPPPTATARAVSPTSPAKQASPTAIPTAQQGSDWKLYRDESLGIEFSYPGACSVSQSNGFFQIGGRIELVIAEARGLSLADYVTQFVDERTRTNGWKVDSQQTATVGSNSAVRIDYRFGGTSRFGTAIFLEGQGRVYAWGLTAGGFTCDEPAAFDGIVSSFRFTPTGR